MQTVVEQSRELRRGMRLREVRPANIPEEQSVPSQHCPRVGRFFLISNYQANALRSMTRRIQHVETQLAYSQLKTALYVDVGKFCPSASSNVNLCTGECR